MIIKFFFNIFVNLISFLDLKKIYIIGIYIGRIYYFFSKKTQLILNKNLKRLPNINRDNFSYYKSRIIDELGKSLIEIFYIWSLTPKDLKKLIYRINGKEIIEKVRKENKPILFLTPHYGAFEITTLIYGLNYPLHIMYRPPRKEWMNDYMVKGRQKGKIKLIKSNLSGVKKIFSIMRNNGAIGLLPDQVPKKGFGEFSKFFGKDAYTMTLPIKIIEKFDPNIIFVYAERLEFGNGFEITLEQIPKNKIKSTRDLNIIIEKIIKKNPIQYYWNYDRYRKP